MRFKESSFSASGSDQSSVTLSNSAGENITVSSSGPLAPVGTGQTFTGIICH